MDSRLRQLERSDDADDLPLLARHYKRLGDHEAAQKVLCRLGEHDIDTSKPDVEPWEIYSPIDLSFERDGLPLEPFEPIARGLYTVCVCKACKANIVVQFVRQSSVFSIRGPARITGFSVAAHGLNSDAVPLLVELVSDQRGPLYAAHMHPATTLTAQLGHVGLVAEGERVTLSVRGNVGGTLPDVDVNVAFVELQRRDVPVSDMRAGLGDRIEEGDLVAFDQDGRVIPASEGMAIIGQATHSAGPGDRVEIAFTRI